MAKITHINTTPINGNYQNICVTCECERCGKLQNTVIVIGRPKKFSCTLCYMVNSITDKDYATYYLEQELRNSDG